MKGKLENDLPLGREGSSRNNLMKGLAIIALLVSGAATAVLFGTKCEDPKKPQTAPKLKVCTPNEVRRVKELIKKSTLATQDQVKGILQKLDETLDKRLDCGWDNVQDAHADLSSRLQP